jgi:hypothetical protein
MFNSMGARFTPQQRQQMNGVGPPNAHPGQMPQESINQGKRTQAPADVVSTF